jgi:nuclear pore complex protein Nup160
MYRYFVRLSREGNAGGTRQLSHTLQERLHALSAAINALQLVDPSFAWLDSVCEADDQISPSKKPCNLLMKNSAFGTDSELSRLKFCVDIEILEKEYTLTEALYMLSTVNSRFNFSDNQSIEALTDILINENMYDMVFTIVLKFRKESGMKRELERVFAAIAQQCCPNRVGNSGKNLLLPSSDDDACDGNGNSIAMAHQSQGSCHWETLEIYLEKYKDLHPRLPVIVAETLLYTDPEIELPLWLVQMFKVIS